MYITCQQCNTIFRLDDSLVKQTGSKVRCCQCRNVFVTYPPEPGKIETSGIGLADQSAAVPPTTSEAALDQELEGIDLAELDSILDHDNRFEEDNAKAFVAEEDLGMVVGEDVVAELDEADLDLDFTIEPEDAAPQPEQQPAGQTGQDIDELDLDMDFELDDGLDEKGAASAEIVEDMPADPVSAPPAGEVQIADVTVSPDDIEKELDELDISLEDGDEAEPEISPVSEEVTAVEDAASDEGLEIEEDATEALGLETEALDNEIASLLDDEDMPESEAEEIALSAEDTAAEDSDEVDLSDLDAILGLDEDSEQVALDIPDAPDAEDFELSLDEGSDEDSEDLSELELAEEPALELDEEPALELDEEPSLELDEEPALELEDEPTLELDEDVELELEDSDEPALEMASDSDSEALMADEGDGLDLSDLDAMLESAPDGSDSDELAMEDADLELELESDAPIVDEDTDLEDLSFELDSEFEDDAAAEEATEAVSLAEEDEELDLSDIEQMLEGDEAPSAEGAGSDTAEGEKWAADGEVELDDADELDLADIEAAIDGADKDADDGLEVDEVELSLSDEAEQQTPGLELEVDDLELEFETEADAPEAELGVEEDSSDELDLSDLGDLVEDQAASATTETIDSGDIELEFEVSEGPEQPVAETAEAFQTTETIDKHIDAQTEGIDSDFAIEDTLPVQAEPELAEDEMAMPAKKKRSSKALILILILLLLGGAGYLFYAVSYMGLNIPYLSEYLNPKPKDPAGILNLATLDINSKFIENEKSGRLFVVTGKVRNGKDTARRTIRMQGKLFTKGKVLVRTEFAYAGISLKDQEVSALSIADIKQRVNNATGPVGSIKTLPGQTAPFMIVFADLPEGLDEFAIEVVSSSEAQ